MVIVVLGRTLPKKCDSLGPSWWLESLALEVLIRMTRRKRGQVKGRFATMREVEDSRIYQKVQLGP
jgi:hypothetical protein